LVFHDFCKSRFCIDIIYINEKELTQDLFQPMPKHLASFGKGDLNISVDYEGGSDEGSPNKSSLY
jgi:hypothetical protein